MSSQELASWIFGSVLLLFIMLVYILDRYFFRGNPIEATQQNVLGFICALLAALFAFFFTGTLNVSIMGNSSRIGQLATQASGGAAAFVIVLWWWKSGLAPVKSKRKPIKITEQNVPARDNDDATNTNRVEAPK